ncbi:MAG: transcriptional regulator [Pseudomonadota bacterium]
MDKGTHRQRLSELLVEGPFTLKELSAEVRLPVREVLDHLKHVQKSVRPPLRFVMHPASCLRCGFVFRERRKLDPPSRCPKCKDSHVQDPRYGVENVKRSG